MWQCRKCSKPVYFAERKQSLGFDWHPNCLRCEECGKCLNPGQLVEHKGVPYCQHPCYAALFGPHVFGHGTRNECHTSFGRVENRDGQIKRSQLECHLKVYNSLYEGKPGELKSREINGKLILEGVLRIYWGVKHKIHLKEEDDSRMIAKRRESSLENTSHYFEGDIIVDAYKDGINNEMENAYRVSAVDEGFHSNNTLLSSSSSLTNLYYDEDMCDVTLRSLKRSRTLDSEPSRNAIIIMNDDHILGQQESDNVCKNNGDRRGWVENDFCDANPICNNDISTESDLQIDSQSFKSEINGPNSILNGLEAYSNDHSILPHFDNRSNPKMDTINIPESGSEVPVFYFYDEHSSKTISSVEKLELENSETRKPYLKRKNRSQLKRRCSINGHFYLRETSSFTPPYGSPCSIWITSKTTAEEVLNMLLDKYKVEMSSYNFALYIVKDTGELRRIRDDESPLITRVMLGPHEDVAKVFIMDIQRTQEVSHEVAQFVNLTLTECRAILAKYEQEETKQIKDIRKRYEDMRIYIQKRIEQLSKN